MLTTHAGKDGTTALKGAHPGGIKYIKHKLSADEWTFAYKVRASYESKYRKASTNGRRTKQVGHPAKFLFGPC